MTVYDLLIGLFLGPFLLVLLIFILLLISPPTDFRKRFPPDSKPSHDDRRTADNGPEEGDEDS